ncbi:MAG TPA: MFS transporter [Gemmatimonadaceae bacterium]|nr:MFS transporter [Gemmatimonadaceae bacterium]
MSKLVVLMFTAFVDMVGSSMIFPLVPYYATRMGANGLMVGVILASFSVAQLLSAPSWGRFSDRYGRRPAILAGLIVSAVAYVVFAYTDSLVLLLVSRVVQGAGAGTVGVLQAYVADTMREEERAKSLGWLSAATSFGVVVGPAFGSLLTVLWGHQAPGLGGAVLCVAVSIFAWRYLRESKEDLAVQAVKRRPRAGRDALVRVITHAGEPAPRLIWIYAVGIGAFYGTGQLMPLILADRFGVTEKTVGWFFMYFGLMGVIIRALMLGPMVRKFREPRVARFGVLVLAAGLVLAGMSQSYLTLFISFTLMPLGTAFLFPCVTALLSCLVTPAERGLQMGVQQTFGGVSRVAFPVAAGIMVDRYGPGVPFVVAGLLVLGTLMMMSSLEASANTAPVAAGD